jgi:enamine deaminase RidA (YjgF/YER057c/UK114 family)
MTARKSIVDVPGAPPAFRPYYSNAVRVTAGDLLFISGQVAWDAGGQVVGVGDGPRQARQAFDNVGLVLAAHGATWGDIVRIVVYVTGWDWFEELATLRTELFPIDGPASAIIGVAGLVQPELMIEVEAVAVLG